MRRLRRWVWASCGSVLVVGLFASCTALLGDDFEIGAAAGASSPGGGSVGGGGGQGLEGGAGGSAGSGATAGGGHGGAGGAGGSPPTLAEQRVLYWSAVSGIRQIYSMRLDGTDPVQLTDTGDDVLFGSVSADGAIIAYARLGDIWVMDGDGSNVRQLTTNAANDYRPALNVDGSLVAFVSERDGPRNIYLATVAQGDAGPVTRVTNTTNETTFPQFSPDNQWITYTNFGTREVYRVRPDGTDVLNLTTHPAEDSCSAYSPDGSSMVFSSNRDGYYELYRMDTDGSNPTRITNQTPAANRDEFHASFDMTGQWVIYYAESPSAIFRTSIDGTETVRLTPDGVAYSDGKIGTWTFPD